MRRFVFGTAILFLCLPFMTLADEQGKERDPKATTAPDPAASLAEKELVGLCERLRNEVDQWFKESEGLSDVAERHRRYAARLDASGLIQNLIDFERTHRGTRIGLTALYRLSMFADSVTEQGAVKDAANHLLSAVADYGELDELTQVLRSFDLIESRSAETSLRRLVAKSEGVSENNRTFAKLMLARWMLRQRDVRDWNEARLKRIATGEVDEKETTKEEIEKVLAVMVPAQRLPELQSEALSILSALVQSKTDAREFVLEKIDREHFLLRVDAERTQKYGALVKDTAAGLLFHEKHLRIGQPAPEGDFALLSGKPLSLVRQQGKVVIVQFSFTGCVACERMYPLLRELNEKYGEKVSIVTIMKDPDDHDMRDAVAAGKITWNVVWDRNPGRITTLWGVRSFPTVYVFGPDGKLAAENPDFEVLAKRVETLLE